ncbi:MAG: hypothetical protein H0T46_09260 [Deltaproteobacteria bacterium]|nr:hypothetical protein [Deltaproteobacteria bacterium]
MFLKATSPPAIGTTVRIDLTLPSASVIVLSGTVDQHVTDPQRGAGVELKLGPIPPASIYMIESALASEAKRRNTPAAGVPVAVQTAYQTGPVATIAEGEDVGAAEQELVSALLAEADSLRKLNPFLVLGVGYEASDGDVRAAFGELTKRYHPDLFARYESRQLRETAAEIFILIRDAYRKLAAEAGRVQALAALGRPAAPRAVALRPGTPPPVPRPPPMPPQRGSSQAISRIPERAPTPEPVPPPPPRPATDFANTARTSFDAATTRHPVPPQMPAAAQPTEPPPRADSTPIPRAPNVSAPLPSKATSSGSMKPAAGTEPPPVVDGSDIENLLDAGKFDEALSTYRVLAKKQPQDRMVRAGVELCEGLRALAQRDRLEAAQRFEAALEIDPSNERAARELADMRRQATNERKGLLTRLMGKKEP